LRQGGQAKRAAKSGSDKISIRDVGENKKRPRGLSSGRKTSMIYRYVKGARNVNTKCESESHVSWLASTVAFGQGEFLKLAKLAKVDSKENPL
jgi:hypothetical protein